LVFLRQREVGRSQVEGEYRFTKVSLVFLSFNPFFSPPLKPLPPSVEPYTSWFWGADYGIS